MGLPSRIVKIRENRVKHAGDFHRPGQQSESLVNARKHLACARTHDPHRRSPARRQIARRPDKVARPLASVPRSALRRDRRGRAARLRQPADEPVGLDRVGKPRLCPSCGNAGADGLFGNAASVRIEQRQLADRLIEPPGEPCRLDRRGRPRRLRRRTRCTSSACGGPAPPPAAALPMTLISLS